MQPVMGRLKLLQAITSHFDLRNVLAEAPAESKAQTVPAQVSALALR